MIFVFSSKEAAKAVVSGKKVFSRKEYSKKALRDLKAWDEIHGGKAGFIFVD